MNEDSIFTEAMNRHDPAERAAFLEASCGGDAGLRQRVEELLVANTEAGSFLETPVLAQGEPGVTQTFAGDAKKDGLELDFLAPPTRPGSLGRLGHYEILEVVGKGGMGVVLRAFDDQLHRIVAVKVMGGSLAASGAARQRFIREARAAAAVSHEHVISIYEVQPEGPIPYLVMELVAGLSLEDKLQNTGALPVQEILRIGYQVACGLAAAHKQGLIHRDIKPANILLMNGVEKVKITDFGLARVADDASVTQSGVIAGTPQYMSPEQAEGHPLDPRSDLFSLGGVLYVMCTGRPPFRASGTMAVMKRVCEETPRPIREINPDIPEALCDVIAKLHAKNPAERHQSAQEVADVLSDLMASGVVAQASAPRESAPREIALTPRESALAPGETRGADATPLARKRRRWSLVLPILAGLFIILVGAIIYIQTERGQFVIETDDPDIVFQVTKTGVRLNDTKNDRTYDMKVAKHDPKTGEYELEVTEPMTGLGFTGKTFTIKRGERVALRASFRPTEEPGWVPLFNGKDLSEWERNPGRPSDWRVEDGVLIGSAPGTNLWSKRKDYRGFHFRADVKISEKGEGAVAFRCDPEEPSLAKDKLNRLEAEIKRTGPNTVEVSAVLLRSDGSGTERGRTTIGGKVSTVPVDEWFTLEFIVRNDQYALKVNGVSVLGGGTFILPAPRWRKGPIALRAKSRTPQPPASVLKFRKIEIKELPGEQRGGPDGAIESIAGAWQSEEGELTLQHEPVRANQPVPVTGSFKLENTSGTIKTGVYDPAARSLLLDYGIEADGVSGTAKMQVANGGAALVGFWRREAGGFAARTFWRKDQAPIDPKTRSVAGTWHSDWEVVIRHEPVRGDGPIAIEGTYAEGCETYPLQEGKFNPRTGLVTFTVQSDGTWLARLLLSPDGQRLSGAWWYKDGSVRSLWMMTRRDADFVPLFNGKDLSGWKTHPDHPGHWKVENGILTGSGPSHLFSERGDYENFHLRAEAKVSEGANSGVWFRTGFGVPRKLESGAAVPHGYEAEIFNGAGAWKTGSLTRLQPYAGALVKPDEWFTLEILASGNRLRVLINGVATVDYLDQAKSHSKGHIALQALWEQGVVQFRKIEIKELPAGAAPVLPPMALAPFDAAKAKEYQDAWARHLGVDVEFTNSIGMKLRLIPPGEFLMGTTEAQLAELLKKITGPLYVARLRSETPARKAVIKAPYFLGAHEVTVGQFRKFVEDAKYRTEDEASGQGGIAWVINRNERKPEFTWRHPQVSKSEDHPVSQVTIHDAQQFCAWLSKREGRQYGLPNEEQWEYACRAGTTTLWHSGDDETGVDAVAWIPQNSNFSPRAVGLKQPNAFGLHDMHGNVAEYCVNAVGWVFIRSGTASIDAVYGRSAARAERPDRERSYFSTGFRVAVVGELSRKALAHAVDSLRPPLDGRWLAVAAEYQGKQVPPDEAKDMFPSELLVKGDQYGITWSGKTHEGSLRIDPTKNPAEIDFTGSVFDGLKPRQAIYELDGDRLKLCVPFVAPGGDPPRPTSFTTDPQSKNAVLTYRRAAATPTTTLKVLDPAKDKPITADFVDEGSEGWRFTTGPNMDYRKIRLCELLNLDVDNCRLIFRAKLKSVEASEAYLRMIARFPGELAMDTIGKRFSAAEGDTNWTTYEVTLDLQPGEKPEVIELNLQLEGRQRDEAGLKKKNQVWIKDIELLKAPLAPEEKRHGASTP